jgi:dienelactone hydrolase
MCWRWNTPFWKSLARIITSLAVLGLLATLALVTWLVIERNRPVVLPAPSGPYAVGRVSYDWVDESRPEMFAAAPGARRELMVWMWYPAAPAPGAQPAAYLPGRWVEVRERDQGIGALLFQRRGSIHAHAIADAPVSPAQARYPVLIMSAGYGRLPTDYAVLAEDLASHGYVVAGIANTYSAPVVVFPDGRVVRRVPEAAISESSPEAGQRTADGLVVVWAADVVSVMNQLERLNADALGLFAGRLDLSRIGVFGHSFGGAATAQACLVDSRCKAGVDVDGTLYGDVVEAGVRQPFMFISSEPRSPAMEEQDRQSFSSSLAHGAYWITIRGCRHFNFTDSAVTFAPVLRVVGMLGRIDGQRGLEVTGDYVRAFFDEHLNAVDTPLLDGASPDYPEVEFRSH